MLITLYKCGTLAETKPPIHNDFTYSFHSSIFKNIEISYHSTCQNIVIALTSLQYVSRPLIVSSIRTDNTNCQYAEHIMHIITRSCIKTLLKIPFVQNFHTNE